MTSILAIEKYASWRITSLPVFRLGLVALSSQLQHRLHPANCNTAVAATEAYQWAYGLGTSVSMVT